MKVLFGVILLLAVASSAQTESVLYRFKGGKRGAYPWASLIADQGGNLYGTTTEGGSGKGCQNGCGTVFVLTNVSGSWKEKVLHSFGSNSRDGIFPFGSLVVDASGNLYGTTQQGGAGWGTVFRLSPGKHGWKTTIIYRFQGPPDGFGPVGNLVLDQTGNVYGSAPFGGITTGNACNIVGQPPGCGVVFELSPSSHSKWKETIVYAFTGGAAGSNPGDLVADTSGNLYGPAWGGSECPDTVCGTIFELSPAIGGWRQAIIYQFSGGNSGASPTGPLIVDQQGNLYGTSLGGVNDSNCLGCGTVFELSPDGKGGWRQSVLYDFLGGTDGLSPFAGVVSDSQGNLYGTTFGGGTPGPGTLFRLTPLGGAWSENVLYSFGVGTDGLFPIGGLLYRAGTLYGTTSSGGGQGCQNDGGCGTIFQMTNLN